MAHDLALSLHLTWCSPVCVVPDPIRGGDNVLVMCEVFYPDGTPHETNTRAKLETIIDDKVRAEECMYGFEQVGVFQVVKTCVGGRWMIQLCHVIPMSPWGCRSMFCECMSPLWGLHAACYSMLAVTLGTTLTSGVT